MFIWKKWLGQKARTGKVHHLKTKIKLFLLVQNKAFFEGVPPVNG